MSDIPLQRVLDEKRSRLEEAVSEPGVGHTWLEPCARTRDGTRSFLEELEFRVGENDFIDMLRKGHDEVGSDSLNKTNSSQCEVLSSDWWMEDVDDVEEGTIESGYVVVEHQHAIDAMAEFLAAYLVTIPEAQSMDALQLQQVVKSSIGEMRSSTSMRTVMSWGRMAVKTAAVGCGSLAAAYSNPWAVRAILRAMYTCFRFAQTFL